MIKDLGFCKMKFYDNYVTCNINEGVTLCQQKSRKQTREILNHFDNKPFVYITNRINSYAVDPSIYNESSQIENLVGFAVVSKNHFALNNAKVEKLFLNKPFELFNDLNDAKQWADELINSK